MKKILTSLALMTSIVYSAETSSRTLEDKIVQPAVDYLVNQAPTDIHNAVVFINEETIPFVEDKAIPFVKEEIIIPVNHYVTEQAPKDIKNISQRTEKNVKNESKKLEKKSKKRLKKWGVK